MSLREPETKGFAQLLVYSSVIGALEAFLYETGLLLD